MTHRRQIASIPALGNLKTRLYMVIMLIAGFWMLKYSQTCMIEPREPVAKIDMSDLSIAFQHTFHHQYDWINVFYSLSWTRWENGIQTCTPIWFVSKAILGTVKDGVEISVNTIDMPSAPVETDVEFVRDAAEFDGFSESILAQFDLQIMFVKSYGFSAIFSSPRS